MDFLPTSDLWWRYFLYGALFHMVAVVPKVCPTPRHAEMFRFAGFAIATIPVFLHDGLINAVWMVVGLYGWSLGLKYFKRFFE